MVIVGGLVALALMPDLTHLGASVGTTPSALGILIESGRQGDRDARRRRATC